MKRYKMLYSLLVTLVIMSCHQAHDHQINQHAQLEMQPAGEAWGALYQQRSAEYKALCFQAYNMARLRLSEQLKVKSKKPLAIVTDIDETVLDNSPYFADLAKKGLVYSDSSWIKWTARVKCDTVPGARQFLRYAAARGVVVYYITNRFEQELAPTIKNLRKWNLPYADSAHVMLMNAEDDSKESRRQTAQEKYKIILLIGDSLGDFDKYFDHLTEASRSLHTINKANTFGDRFIVLPNAMYGSWEDVLYKARGANTIAKKNEVLFDDLSP